MCLPSNRVTLTLRVEERLARDAEVHVEDVPASDRRDRRPLETITVEGDVGRRIERPGEQIVDPLHDRAVGRDPDEPVGAVQGDPQVPLGVEREAVRVGPRQVDERVDPSCRPVRADLDPGDPLRLGLDHQERVAIGRHDGTVRISRDVGGPGPDRTVRIDPGDLRPALLAGTGQVEVPGWIEHRDVRRVERFRAAVAVVLERAGVGVVSGDASATVVACIHATVPVDREPEHPPTGRAEQLGLARGIDPIQLARLTAGVEAAGRRVPCDALRMVHAIDELTEILERGQSRGLFRSLRTTFAAFMPFAPLTPPPGCVPAPHR